MIFRRLLAALGAIALSLPAIPAQAQEGLSFDVGFSTAYECIDLAPGETCYKPEQVANNIFLRSRLAHHDGWDAGSHISHAGNDFYNNLYWPDGPQLFCFGLCAWPGQAPCKNCTDFATFERDQPHPLTSNITRHTIYKYSPTAPQDGKLADRASIPRAAGQKVPRRNCNWGTSIRM